MAITMVTVFLSSCEKETSSKDYKEIILNDEDNSVKIRFSHDNPEVLKRYDQASFKLLISDHSNHNHDHNYKEEGHPIHPEPLIDELISEKYRNDLPNIEIIDANMSGADYSIELTSLNITQEAVLDSRGCSWTNGACVYHGGCWRSKYKCSCGGYHYSTCSFGSPWHYHSY